ncbi:hypothetical protein [Haladaptatus sp. DYF46]|uniref:hypothetical protein n=1 Tax=Haladaptatus sp. DYF46 TaxID=2886041 RepID=UPI001E35E4FD|nr:hypothetical protein [Haladaptatus sp. DYF46]
MDSSETAAVNGLEERELYELVHRAVEDAILGMVGTLLLVGVAVVLVWTGVTIALYGTSIVGLVAGIAAIVFGLYLGLATLEIIPSVREWF